MNHVEPVSSSKVYVWSWKTKMVLSYACMDTPVSRVVTGLVTKLVVMGLVTRLVVMGTVTKLFVTGIITKLLVIGRVTRLVVME